jgi:hypothetical protein
MRQWTQEERLRQAELIRSWKPWKKSTGAKTSAGKAISKMNAYKHGGRAAGVRAQLKIIAEYKSQLQAILRQV